MMPPHLTGSSIPEDGVLILPTDQVIRSLKDYIVYGLHQGISLTRR